MQTTRLLQQRVICSLLWGVLLVTSALSLSAQTTYKGVKTPPQDLTADGSLETKAYVRGVSPSGRYIWAAYYYNQAAYVYDTELKKCIWQKSNAGTEIDIKYVSDEGDIVYQKDRTTTVCISHTGQEVAITSPDSDYPMIEITGVSQRVDRMVGNMKLQDPLKKDMRPFVANRTAQGDFAITPLPTPAEDALGGKPEGTSVLALSPDGMTLIGRQVNSDSYYPRLIQWTIPEGQSVATEYTFPGESLFFNLDKRKPGPQPKRDDYDSDQAWERAYDAWENALLAYSKKPMLDPTRCYYSPSTQRILFAARQLVLDQESGAIDQVLMPGYWDLREQRGEVLTKYEGCTATEALDDGSLLCIEEAKSFYHCYRIDPKSSEKENFALWIKQRTGIPMEEFYSLDDHGEIVLGWPYISQDGKTLALFGPDLSNPYLFRGTYIQFTDPLGAHTAIQAPLPTQPHQLRVSSEGLLEMPEMAHHQIAVYTPQGELIALGVVSASGLYQIPQSSLGSILLIHIVSPLTGASYSYRLLPMAN